MLNAEWHAAHKMPRNATPEQRVDWHVAHSEACGCRKPSARQLEEIARLRPDVTLD
jgi:hypothetical protein